MFILLHLKSKLQSAFERTDSFISSASQKFNHTKMNIVLVPFQNWVYGLKKKKKIVPQINKKSFTPSHI